MTARPIRAMMGRVARNLGTSTAAGAPSAARVGAPGWRDVRLWIGVALVSVSVIAGTKMMASADDSVSVWGVSADMGVGDRVTEEDLVPVRVHFPENAGLERYLTVEEALPADLELTRGLGEGELLPRAAVGSAVETGIQQIPIAVDAEQIPASVVAGSIIDVYLVQSSAAPAGGDSPGGPATASGAALEAVTVLDAPGLEDGFATSGKRQLVLAVAEQDVRRFYGLLGSLDNPVITVVWRG